ncbi:iron(III) transport system ATP-binding protein [Ancylobacter sp. 3268]|uniref:ABC transporter ATP-binding protein n=1 Tax=Ancylobacter sp. 3268 TaxID=2817752 RepID=UPI002859EB24|nr:ABC transporter ATP-binding protein [Ancylobacter sp. 3268]MDR6952501.1 iron(III) transport system ATP-binding protein [Ancylobacter sp. 3268]
MAGIQINNLSKYYGTKEGGAAVSALNLDIKDNQFVTLLGPSGCGKTTTLRLIAGYVTPDAGTIRVGDRVVSSADGVAPPDQRGMGMVFQNYAVWPHKTVFENVVFGLKLRKVPAEAARRKVLDTLAMVNLGGLENRLPNELSGGQQQRVALARSLVVEPGILLLDEPLSNLDAKLREKMRTELKQLQRRTGITFVYVTHDQAEALALSDQIAVMHGGELQQYGSPDDVYRRPANKIVADFMGIVNFLPGTVVAGSGASAGRLAVAIDGVEVPAPVHATYSPGQPVDLSVRPENIRLSPGAAPGALGAVVTDMTYLGNLVEYWLQLESGTALRAQTHPLERFAIGDRVGLSIDAADCSVFSRAAAH